MKQNICVPQYMLKLSDLVQNSILILLFSIFVACGPAPSKHKNVIIITVDELSNASIHCDSESIAEEGESGFQILCGDAIRFTHAYTNSVLAQPALTTLLTGLNAFEHNVNNNGNNFLDESFVSLAEIAMQNSYQTSFFTGGASIWRKSGLAQGFELFDENFKFDLQNIYRPAEWSFNDFLNWYDTEAKDKPIFSVFYLPDLIFTASPTFDRLGVLRESSYNGQWNELNESLEYLFQNLKSRNLYNDSWIILLGLNGRSQNTLRNRQLQMDLHNNNIQIAAFVKPPVSFGGAKIKNLDFNVSLLNFSDTIKAILQNSISEEQAGTKRSLLNSLRYGIDMEESEPILLENDWANWHQFGGRRYAVIINEYLIGASRPNSVDNLYNSLSVQSTFTQLEESYIYKFKQILQKNNLVSNYSIDLSIWARLAYAQMYSGQWYSVPAMQDLDSLLKQYPKDSKLLSWRAMLALEFQDWHKLKQLAKNYKKSDWLLIAEKNIEGKSKVESQCLSLFFQKNYREKIFKLNCSDKSLRLLYAWIKGPHAGKEQAREEFLKSYHSIVLNQWLEHLNYSSGLMWDIHIESYMQPTNIDLILNSKDFRYYKNIVQRRLSPISQSEN